MSWLVRGGAVDCFVDSDVLGGLVKRLRGWNGYVKRLRGWIWNGYGMEDSSLLVLDSALQLGRVLAVRR